MDYPDRVRGLLLLAPSVAPALEAPRWYQRLATWRVVQWLLPRTLIDANRELMPLQAQLRELEPGWAKLRMPVYVIQGEDDALVDPRTADYLERVLAHTPHRIWRYPDRSEEHTSELQSLMRISYADFCLKKQKS